jgi:hypothetical protein
MEGIKSSWAKPDRRAGILFVQKTECDCCDHIKDCAIIDIALVKFNWNICKDCLKEFIDQINESE